MNDLVPFDEVRAEIAKYKVENANLAFDYTDAQGEKDARSHIYKLRQTKTKIATIHKATKAEALAACRAIDGEKNTLVTDVDEMIDVHLIPIKAIETRRNKEREAKLKAERLERERIEQERLDAIAKQEEEIARKQAEIKAEEARVVRERENLEADKLAEADAKRREAEVRKQAEIDKKEALAQAERDKIAAVEAEKEKARKAEAAAATERQRIADEASQKAENELQAKIAADKVEADRAADENHRADVHILICNSIVKHAECDKQTAENVIAAIVRGEIPNVTINY